MGADGSAPVDKKVERAHHPLIIILIAASIFLGCLYSPPHLMDDVDAVQAQISRNMLESGDWVTARLDGITYLEKSPLGYWLSAFSYEIFGVKDWAGRLPLALSVIGLCWLDDPVFRNVGVWSQTRFLFRISAQHLTSASSCLRELSFPTRLSQQQSRVRCGRCYGYWTRMSRTRSCGLV